MKTNYSGWPWVWRSYGRWSASSFPWKHSGWISVWIFRAGVRFPARNAAGGAYDTQERTWRHLNFFQHETCLHARHYEWNHTAAQQELFAALRALDLKTNKAHHLKGVFLDIYACSPEEGEALLRRWYYWAAHSRMQPVIAFVKPVKRHWDGGVRWFTTKISNGLLEGMNRLIQAAKARSRGFRHVHYFTTMIYLIGGKLEFHLPSPLPVTHTE